MAGVTNVLEILRLNKYLILSDLFAKYKDIVLIGMPNPKLKEVLRFIILSLELTQGQEEFSLLESFKQVYKSYWKYKTIEEFCKIVISWASINKLEYIPVQGVKSNYKEYLNKLKKYYEKASKLSCEQDRALLSAGISRINSKLSLFAKLYYYENPVLTFREELLLSEKTVLHEIFDFYANSHLIVSKFTTFDGLKIQKMLWSCGVFIKFCTSFQLSTRISKLKPSISHKALISIFTKHSILKKSMDFQGFINSLEDLGSEYYKIPENTPFPIETSTLTPSFYKIALLDHKKILNLQKIRQILKMSVKSFASIDSKPRILDNDPCFNYKFVISASVQNKLKQIKLEKQKNQKKKVTCQTEPSVRVRTRPMSSYLSVKNFRKSVDIVKVYSQTRSKASLSDDLIVENC